MSLEHGHFDWFSCLVPVYGGEVAGCQPVANVSSQFLDRAVMEGFDGGFFDGAHHAFSLTFDLGVIGFGEPVLDTILPTDALEDVADPNAAIA
jgi:hypothetical protein